VPVRSTGTSPAAVAALPPAPSIPPAPPPFVPGEPARPIAPPVAVAPALAERSGGGAAGIAGCFGLSLFGMVTVGTLGFLTAGLVLVVAAAGLGWIAVPGGGGPGGGTDPIVVDGPDPDRFRNAPPLSEADARKVVRAVREGKAEIASHCGTGAAVTAWVLVDASGEVVFAKVDRTGLGAVERPCVKRGLERIKVRSGISAEGTTQVQFPL
ncbi:MAG: hypothetical protein ABMB14_34980, partial [Myxococcota bacterium]